MGREFVAWSVDPEDAPEEFVYDHFGRKDVRFYANLSGLIALQHALREGGWKGPWLQSDEMYYSDIVEKMIEVLEGTNYEFEDEELQGAGVVPYVQKFVRFLKLLKGSKGGFEVIG